MADTFPVLRLGTRGSLLARTQSQLVADDLMRRHPGLRVELLIVRTSGDRITDRPLHEFGGKGLFTKELEQALLAGEVDFAVHSFKDVPVTMPLVDTSGLTIAAVPARHSNPNASPAGSAAAAQRRSAASTTGRGRSRCRRLSRGPPFTVRSRSLRAQIARSSGAGASS